ncbi:MAG: YceI family protein [Lewinellaceae bacterium]|nr:YceI family protein [Lewinellaceae bacterium]
MSTSTAAVAQQWALDTAHTEVQFKVKHLVISTVTGAFKSFSGTVNTENENFDQAEVNFQLDVNSIDTNNTDRDNHLKSADFFAADEFPQITFSNGILKLVKDEEYALNGDLTIRGVTHPITLAVTFNGTMKDPWGNMKAGFEITGKLNRKDYGLNWNAITEAGGMLVGEEVKLVINAQLAVA